MARYPRAAGMPDYSGNFIPELWDSRIQVRFYAQTVFQVIANTMYEGNIKKFGDVVNIRTYPDITIGTYAKGQDLDIQVPDSTPTTLVIDKGKYQLRYLHRATDEAKRVNCWEPNRNAYGNQQVSQKYTSGNFNDYRRNTASLMTGFSARLS